MRGDRSAAEEDEHRETEENGMREITRADAIKALDSLFEKAFGNDKGSGEMYEDWARERGLCDDWDGYGEVTDGMVPPGQWDILLAMGVTPAELIEHLHANPAIFEPREEKAKDS